MKILLLYPEIPETFWSFKHALKFIDKKASNPPLGLITIAAMLPEAWELKLVDLNVEKLDAKDLEAADMVFISGMVIQRESARILIDQCHLYKKPVVAGGPLFTCEPDVYEDVEYLILNEAEITLPQFLEDLNQGRAKHIYQTLEFADITHTPSPRLDLIKKNAYDSMNLQFSRGCPFNCDFCNITSMLGHVPRIKTTRQIIQELDNIYNIGWRRNIFFVDDNFIGNKKILKSEILPALIEWRKNKVGCHFITETSINLADDKELTELMVKAGFTSIFVGIETPDEISLKDCNKKQNQNRDLLADIHYLQNAGIQVMAGFIVGFDQDTPTIFQRQIDFIQESGIITAMVGLLQAMDGTTLYKRLEKEGRLISLPTGDNVDGNTNIIPKMGMNQLRKGYFEILSTIFDPKMVYQRIQTFLSYYQPADTRFSIDIHEIGALFKAMFHIGILQKDRMQFWNLFFNVLFHNPSQFPMAVTLSIYGYHFGKMTNRIQNTISKDTKAEINLKVLSRHGQVTLPVQKTTYLK